MNTYPMFSIPLGTTFISQSICDKIKPLKGITLNTITQNTAYDDAFDVLKNHPEIKQELTNTFVKWVNEALRLNTEWVITSSWITENYTGEAMTRHSHKNCYYSSVLYFDKIEENHPRLMFENPIYIFNTLIPQNFETLGNQYNASEFCAPIEERRILFFPSYLFHMHPKFKASIPRRSLACNFFPIGKYGHHDSTLDTNWLRHGI